MCESAKSVNLEAGHSAVGGVLGDPRSLAEGTENKGGAAKQAGPRQVFNMHSRLVQGCGHRVPIQPSPQAASRLGKCQHTQGSHRVHSLEAGHAAECPLSLLLAPQMGDVLCNI
jgi:hypothetical protein